MLKGSNIKKFILRKSAEIIIVLAENPNLTLEKIAQKSNTGFPHTANLIKFLENNKYLTTEKIGRMNRKKVTKDLLDIKDHIKEIIRICDKYEKGKS